MKPIYAVLLLALLLVVGCQSPEQKIIGKWSGEGGNSIEFKADKTFSTGAGPMSASGTWALNGKDVALTVQNLNGKPKKDAIEDARKQMQQMGMKKDMIDQQIAQAEKLFADMKMTLSEDGKSLTSNMMGQTMTLTKQQS